MTKESMTILQEMFNTNLPVAPSFDADDLRQERVINIAENLRYFSRKNKSPVSYAGMGKFVCGLYATGISFEEAYPQIAAQFKHCGQVFARGYWASASKKTTAPCARPDAS